MQVLPLLLFVALTISAAVAPAVLYSLLIWWLDRYEKEPWGLLAATFIWGAIPAVVLSLVGEFLLEVPFSGLFGEATGRIIGGSVVAPVVEEVVKGLAVLLLFLIFRREFDGLLDGIVYGALVGFGFGMTEDLFYFLAGFLEGGAGNWLMVVFLRTTIFGLNHAMFTSITGAGFGYASIASNICTRWLAPPLALCGAILAHSVHNVSTTVAQDLGWPVMISLANAWGGVLVILAVVCLSWDRERRRMVEELGDEVRAGTISEAEYETVPSYRRRVAAQWRTLSRHGLREARAVRRFHQLATELAFKKHRLRSGRAGERGRTEVTRLRQQIKALRAEIAEQ
jgi:RsiW-degrading membrane proteinase PrsW (M82 family)